MVLIDRLLLVSLHLNEGDKWHRYHFFKVATAGVLDYVSQHLLSQVKQFTSIFKRFLTIALRWHFLYYVRGLCRLISKKSSKCAIWLNKISPNFTLILKSDSSCCSNSWFKVFGGNLWALIILHTFNFSIFVLQISEL